MKKKETNQITEVSSWSNKWNVGGSLLSLAMNWFVTVQKQVFNYRNTIGVNRNTVDNIYDTIRLVQTLIDTNKR